MGKLLSGLAFAILSLGANIASSAQSSQPAAPAAQPEIRTGVFRGQSVSFAVIGGKAVLEGDILLDHVQEGAPVFRSSPRPDTLGIAYAQYFWPKNAQGVAQVPYAIANGAPALSGAISTFNATFGGIIQFVARTTETDYVNFNFDSANHNGSCESYVGRVGGSQQVGGSIDCNLGTVLHEMGHAVGLYHEQSRSDRDTYVTFNFGNSIKGSKSNFDQVIDNAQTSGLYDYGSVMHYIAWAFSRNGAPTLESIPAGIPLSNATGYTAGDVDTVKRLYGGAPKSVTIDSNPSGLTVIVDGASTVTPAVFNWALKSQHTLSVSSDAQTLSGVTYAYGRWSDDTAATHTITLTPGNKTLAQPSTSPAVTVYTANFIQLEQYTATAYPAGTGSVAASPAPQSYPGASGVFYRARQAVTLTPTPVSGYSFLEWGGTTPPWSASPKTEIIPDYIGGAFAVTAYFTNKPVTTITTSPAGLGFVIDNNAYWYGPQNFASDYFSGWTPGSTHSITMTSPQQPYSINTRYIFKNWSDGGALSHNITIPGAASTIKATFNTQYVPIAYATPSCAATVALSPSSPDGFYNSGTSVTFTATPASGWIFTGWQADLKGVQNPQTLVDTGEELAVANYNISATPLTISSFNPSRIRKGSSATTVAIRGAGFTSSSIVFVNNAYRATSYISPTLINVALTAADLATATAYPIGVSNFPSGAPCSAYFARPFFVTN